MEEVWKVKRSGEQAAGAARGSMSPADCLCQQHGANQAEAGVDVPEKYFPLDMRRLRILPSQTARQNQRAATADSSE